MKGGEKNI